MDIYRLGDTSTAEYTVVMAIVDFLPVLFYFIPALMVANDLYNKVSKATYALLSSGAIMVFCGGAFKATWKLLFALGLCNYPYLFTAQFPLQAPGFCFFFIGLIMTLRQTGKKAKKDTADGTTSLGIVTVPVVTKSLPFIALVTLGSIGGTASLAILAYRMKKPSAIICFIFSIIGLLAMGYLGATLDSSLAWASWAEQGSNTLAQLLFFVGVYILDKNGLGDPELGKESN